MSVSTVNTSQFNAFCQQISILSAVPYRDVVKAEVGRVLTQTIKNTPALKVGKLRTRFENANYSQQRPSMYAPQSREGRRYRYEEVKLSKNGSVIYNLHHRYPTALWNTMQAKRREHLARVIRARGLAQKSWVKIGEALEMKIEHPAYIDAAVAVTGQQYVDTSATETTNASKVQVLIANGQPTVNIPEVGGERALKRAMAGRVKFFEQNAQHAVFADMAKVARAYPGLKITVPAAATA